MSDSSADGVSQPGQPQTRRPRRWGLVGGLGFIPFLGIIALVWMSSSSGPSVEAEYSLISGAGVTVARTEAGWEFAPDDDEPTFGLVLYPGAKIDPRSYSTLAREIVESQDAIVVITPMKFGLAVLSPQRANDVLAAHPEIDRWGIIGHSLGGVAACEFASQNPGALRLLVLLAAYPAEDVDLSSLDVEVVSITASEDTLLDQEAFEAARARLPADTLFIEIEGGNHAQFGSYGAQRGDGNASIGAVEQRARLLEALQPSMESLQD